MLQVASMVCKKEIGVVSLNEHETHLFKAWIALLEWINLSLADRCSQFSFYYRTDNNLSTVWRYSPYHEEGFHFLSLSIFLYFLGVFIRYFCGVFFLARGHCKTCIVNPLLKGT